MARYPPSPYYAQYINSGVYMGTPTAIQEIIGECLRLSPEWRSTFDQRLLGLYFLENPDSVLKLLCFALFVANLIISFRLSICVVLHGLTICFD